MPDSQHRLNKQLMASPDRFLNRELSGWSLISAFLRKPAADHPLLERLRFLSISASNLDEFDMVRYAGLREQVRAGITRPSQDGLTPARQVEEIEAAALRLIGGQLERWRELKDAMEKEGIFVLSPSELTKRERADIEAYFHSNVFPILTPLSIDPAHPFPFIPNLGSTIAFDLESATGGEGQVGIVPMPTFVRRFIRLPKGNKPGIRFIALEDVIGMFLPALFPGFTEAGRCLFRIVRDSDIEIEEEAEDLIREFEVLLKQRRRGRIVRLRMQASAPDKLRKFIMREIGAESSDIVLYDGILGMARLSEMIVEDRPDLLFPPYEPRYPERIREMGGDIFAAVRAKDILVHHPFESFDVVVEFVRQAANDPQVVAIKQTLYRTTINSPIVGALIEAAESGKTVTALVEIKARFDEEANLRLARDTERAGVQVVYGFISIKRMRKCLWSCAGKAMN